MTYLIPYLATIGTLAVLDTLFLKFIARGFYLRQLGHLMREAPIWLPIIFFYIFYAAGILIFAAMPSDTFVQALVRGAIFGFMAYMTYDLVNYATLEGWLHMIVYVDVVWGALLTAAASGIAFKFT